MATQNKQDKKDNKPDKKWGSGGLRSKILKLCIILVVGTITVFAIVGILQLRSIAKMSEEVGETQSQTIKEISGETVRGITEQSMAVITEETARLVDGEFWTFKHDLNTLSKQVEDMFRHPDHYDGTEITPPLKQNAGKYSLQYLCAESADPNDGKALYMLRKLALLAPSMEAIIKGDEEYYLDCYIALPSGHSLAMDKLSEKKYTDEGTIRPYDARTRLWYKGAVKKKSLYFTPAAHSYFYDLAEIAFGMPVYVDGELVAVLEGSTKIEAVQKGLAQLSFGESSYIVMLNDRGQVIYSPNKTGELVMDDEFSKETINSVNEGLQSIMKKAVAGERGFKKVKVDGVNNYVSYAPLETLGGSIMMFILEEELDAPTNHLLGEMSSISEKSSNKLRKNLEISSWLALIAVILLIANAAIVAIAFSGRLTKPISVMTDRIKSFSGDDMTFDMEEIYKTGDEIEILAEAFGDLSSRTKEYIKEIMQFTAEKEHFAAELDVAKNIQKDMLPSLTLLFNDREEFVIFASMDPAKEVGGDFYDAFLIDEDHLCMVMADVSGKGIPASLFMVISKTLLQERALQGDLSPADILRDVNNRLYEKAINEMFVTVWIGILTISTGELVDANAGHEDLVTRRAGGDFEVDATKHGFVLGGIEDVSYIENRRVLNEGDTIFIYTDGVPEATDKDNNMYGIERMTKALNANKDVSPGEMLRAVKTDIDAFVGEAPQFDDLTMLAMVYHGKAGE